MPQKVGSRQANHSLIFPLAGAMRHNQPQSVGRHVSTASGVSRVGGAVADRIEVLGDDMEPEHMSELWSIVEEHSREYGPTTSAIARRMGTTSQTLFNWRDRELREMPHQDTLRALSDVTRRPLESVIAAAVTDVYGLGVSKPRTVRPRKVAVAPKSEAAAPPAQPPGKRGTPRR